MKFHSREDKKENFSSSYGEEGLSSRDSKIHDAIESLEDALGIQESPEEESEEDQKKECSQVERFMMKYGKKKK